MSSIDPHIFTALALRSGLGLWAVGIKPHRTWTSLRKALDQATVYTGKPYKGRKDIMQAQADLLAWCDQRKSALQKEETL